MNLEKFTDRAKGFLQSAQTVAIRMNHQRITPEHLLKALLEDSEGMAAGLIQRAGGNAQVAVTEIDAALAKIAAVSGSGAQQTPGLDNDTVRILDRRADRGKAGDSFVSVQRLSRRSRLRRLLPPGRLSKRPMSIPRRSKPRSRRDRRPHRGQRFGGGKLRRDAGVRPRPHRKRHATASSIR